MENLNQFVLFDLGEETYALPTSYVIKIDSIKKNKVRFVPNTFPYIKGIITLEDDIVPLMSLPERFNIKSNVKPEDAFVIVCHLKEKGISAGFIVDAVHDVIEFPENFELSSVNEVITGNSTKFISGIYRLQEKDDEETLLIILDIEKLLSENGLDDFIDESQK